MGVALSNLGAPVLALPWTEIAYMPHSDESSKKAADAALEPQPAPAAPAVSISLWHRRLARYLYLEDLIRGRRVLELGCGDGAGAEFLLQKGAAAVVGIDDDDRAISRGQARLGGGGRVILRYASHQELGQPSALGPDPFGLLLVSDARLLSSPAILAELRRARAADGYVVATVTSREAQPDAPGALGYFDLMDTLEQVGRLGPVTMLGQSPFLASTLVPFGVDQPALMMDDSLAGQEPPAEYIALCGAQRGARPFQVVQLPSSALHNVAGADPEAQAKLERAQAELAAARAELERAQAQVTSAQRAMASQESLRTELVQAQRATEQLSSECKRLRGDAQTLRTTVDEQAERLRAQAHAAQESLQRGGSALQEAVRKEQEALRREQEATRQASEQRARADEAAEGLRQREASLREHQSAAVRHEREMSKLRGVLDERDAFIAELEGQARAVGLLSEELQQARAHAAQAEHAERLARKQVAEAQGQTLRAEAQLRELTLELQRASTRTPPPKPGVDPGDAEGLAEARAALLKERESFAAERAELAGLAEGREGLAQARRHLEEARATLEKDRERLQGGSAAVERDRQRMAATEARLTAEREQLLQEQASVAVQVGEIDRTRTLLEQERQQAARDREELSRLRVLVEAERAATALERQQKASAEGGVPVLVGDLPTAPHSGLAPVSAAPAELERLATRVKELEQACVVLKEKASDAERDSWKYMKARSDAEAEAAATREDAARKLRDARKLASVELTRAMEEATKKAVSLREELTRTERERKDALAQIAEVRAARDLAQRESDTLRQEIEALRWSTALQPAAPVLAPAADDSSAVRLELQRAREESAAAVLAVRTEAERAMADEKGLRQAAEETRRRAELRQEELRAQVLTLELSLGAARDSAESERQRVETLQEELRRMTDEVATRQQEVEAELGRVQADLLIKERSVTDLRAERETLGRMLNEVEREAYSRAERARELRTRMLEREREVEALRVELLDRDRRITALEQQVPPAEEVVRLEAELQAARARLSDLEAERARQDAASDEAVATALRERARATRLGESLQQAVRERDEALGRVAELEGRLQTATEERERLRGEAARLGAASRQAHGELQALSDRLKQTRRELEAEEKRATREAERAQAAVELGRQYDEARQELQASRLRALEMQTELAKSRAELSRIGHRGVVTPVEIDNRGAAAAPAIKAETPSAAQAATAELPPPAPVSSAAVSGGTTDSDRLRPPVLEHRTVRRVLALGQALGLEPLHVPLPGEPGPSKPGDGEDPSGSNKG